jgi:MFS family permease
VKLDERFRWLILFSLSEIGAMLVLMNYSALLPLLQKEWSLTNGQAGWIYSSYHIGYILAVVALTSLTDYIHPKYIYITTAFWGGISGILFSALATGFVSALVLRLLMGISFAGTYMPGLRMVSEKFPSHERGRAIGIYVGAFTLGGSLSLFLAGFLISYVSWRWAFFFTSLGPIAGGIIAVFQLRGISGGRSVEEKRVPLKEVFRNRPVLMIIGGYIAHMWEMFGMRGWAVTFLTACFLTNQFELSRAVRLSAAIGGAATLMGAISSVICGTLSDRLGRANTIITIMLGSCVVSFVIGWTREFPLWIIFILSLLHGSIVPAESSVLSTGITELAHPGVLGRTMALQSLMGFGAASLSPIVFGYILDLTNPSDALARYGYVPNWGWAFVMLGIGGLVGPLVIWKVKGRMSHSPHHPAPVS